MNTKRFLQTLIVAIISLGCKNSIDFSTYESDTLKIEKVSDNVYKHISYLETEDYGKVACNGIFFINSNEVIIFDTPTSDLVSEELIDLISRDNKIVAVVATHFHIDCLAGLDEFHKQNIASYANNLTIELAKNNNNPLPQNGFKNKLELDIGTTKVISQFLGEGHTRDNIIGYIPSEKVLFGGCLVKSLNASKGNLADANTEQWTETILNINSKFQDVEFVVPGHGKNGGKSLLDYTAKLFKNN